MAGEHSSRINTLFEEWDQDRSPGAIVAVVHGGNVIHQRGYGVANIEDDVPFTADTVLRLGSTSKHLCATCILILENRGKLTLDDDVRQYVPELPKYETPISLRHLLTMTSGLWDGLNILLFAGLDPTVPLSRDQLLHLYTIQEQLMFRPGDDCTYANTNYSLLSLVIERVSGLTLVEFMRAELFEPLGMLDSQLTPTMKETRNHKAKGYVPRADGGFEAGFMMVELDGNGGVDSTTADMLKWVANYRDDQHFGPSYRCRMEAVNCLNDGRALDYRLGINVADYRGMEVVRHAGGMPGYLCDFVFFPEADLGIVLFSNVLATRILDLPDQIADIVLEHEFTQALDTTFVDAEREDLAPLVGVYAAEKDGLVLELLNLDGKLICFLLGDLNPLRENHAWMESRKAEVAIRVADPVRGRDAGVLLRLGCQAPTLLMPVDHPRLQPVPPSADLSNIAGLYVNESMHEIHEIQYEQGRLAVRIPSPVRDLIWCELSPLVGDLFVALIDNEPSCTNVVVQFLRDEQGVVDSFSYSINRCRNVIFSKTKERL